MRPTLTGVIVTLLVLILAVSFSSKAIGVASAESSDAQIDVFTQKDIYDGRGPNAPSDAFGPEEIMILYALVLYNDRPLENALVAFGVSAPSGASFSLSSETNSSGHATVRFTIMTPPTNVSENEIFGVWTVLANVLISSRVYQDTMAVEVDYVVKLISARTLDGNLTTRRVFGKGSDVGLEVTLRSVAITVRSATLSIVIQDEVGVPVSSYKIQDFKVQPNRKPVYLYCKLQFPKWAVIGQATIFISAFDSPLEEGGTPYCPGVSTSFMIMFEEPVFLDFYDVAVVNVLPSSTLITQNMLTNVSVLVQNEGTTPESFNVVAYCDDVLLGTSAVSGLLPYSSQSFEFVLNGSLFAVGNHTLSAVIPQLENEADLTDNLFVDGLIEIRSWPPFMHDIAVVDISVSNGSVYMGDPLQINASVLNKGNATESFSVELYGNLSLIDSKEILAFAPNASTTLVFALDTSLMAEGLYEIKAYAPLLGDMNESDNTYVDGFVEIKRRPVTPPVLEHDIAVTYVNTSSLLVFVGETINIQIDVSNSGNFTESFDVAVYRDSSSIGIVRVQELAPGSVRRLTVNWDTTPVPEGNYTISALAGPVSGEANLANNQFTDGTVEVVKGPEGFGGLDWYYWSFLILFLGLIAALLAIWLYRRRKRDAESFYSGWTAWYYCHALKHRVGIS